MLGFLEGLASLPGRIGESILSPLDGLLFGNSSNLTIPNVVDFDPATMCGLDEETNAQMAQRLVYQNPEIATLGVLGTVSTFVSIYKGGSAMKGLVSSAIGWVQEIGIDPENKEMVDAAFDAIFEKIGVPKEVRSRFTTEAKKALKKLVEAKATTSEGTDVALTEKQVARLLDIASKAQFQGLDTDGYANFKTARKGQAGELKQFMRAYRSKCEASSSSPASSSGSQAEAIDGILNPAVKAIFSADENVKAAINARPECVHYLNQFTVADATSFAAQLNRPHKSKTEGSPLNGQLRSVVASQQDGMMLQYINKYAQNKQLVLEAPADMLRPVRSSM